MTAMKTPAPQFSPVHSRLRRWILPFSSTWGQRKQRFSKESTNVYSYAAFRTSERTCSSSTAQVLVQRQHKHNQLLTKDLGAYSWWEPMGFKLILFNCKIHWCTPKIRTHGFRMGRRVAYGLLGNQGSCKKGLSISSIYLSCHWFYLGHPALD